MPRGTPPLYVKCRARNRRGQACGRWALRGAAVCVSHGAAAPQVRRRAAERMALLAPAALASLERLLEPSVDERLQLAAARLILSLAAATPAGTGTGVDAAHRLPGADDLADHEIQRIIDAARSQRQAVLDDEVRFAV
jgi:hypothetical protein